MKKIVFTGGGTAGHIMPNLALTQNLKNYKIYYLGSNGMEKEIVSKHKDITFVEIPTVKFVRSLTLKNLLIPFKLIKSISTCKKILSEIKPDVVFSKGGYVSVPVCLSASKLKIPVLTHESDLTVGLANKIIAKKAKYLCCSFRETANSFGKNAIFTGSPVRNSIFNGNKNIVLKRHNITGNLPIILVVGGSLGAKAINEVIYDSLKQLTQKYIVIHIVGKNNLTKVDNTIKNYIQVEFAQDIENYFDASDIVISRSGSNTIFELLAIKKPMILIPLPKGSSRGDQILNAENFERHKFASVIYQEDLNTSTLLSKINYTLQNKASYISAMSKSKFSCGNEKLISLIDKASTSQWYINIIIIV